MRLNLSELNLDRCSYPPNHPFIRRAVRGVELTRKLRWALREFDQLSYCYRFPLTVFVCKCRLACSAGRPNPNLP